MSETDTRHETIPSSEAEEPGTEDAAAGQAPGEAPAEAGTEAGETATEQELEILRNELLVARTALEEARQQSENARDRYLRARAEMENVRRRSAQELERAREAGLDSAVLTVLTVYDDLSRALSMAEESDPAKIVPGVRAVQETLERNLQNLGITRVGEVGDAFDPDVHEALGSMPGGNPSQAGTIAEVYQAGFRRGERLVRPARVVVYQD